MARHSAPQKPSGQCIWQSLLWEKEEVERGQGKHPVVSCRVAAFLICFLGVSREDHDFEGFTFWGTEMHAFVGYEHSGTFLLVCESERWRLELTWIRELWSGLWHLPHNNVGTTGTLVLPACESSHLISRNCVRWVTACILYVRKKRRKHLKAFAQVHSKTKIKNQLC